MHKQNNFVNESMVTVCINFHSYHQFIMNLAQQVCIYLRKTALVIQYAQYPMRLCSNEVKTGLVVAKGLLLPLDLFPHVLLLHAQNQKFVGLLHRKLQG